MEVTEDRAEYSLVLLGGGHSERIVVWCYRLRQVAL